MYCCRIIDFLLNCKLKLNKLLFQNFSSLFILFPFLESVQGSGLILPKILRAACDIKSLTRWPIINTAMHWLRFSHYSSAFPLPPSTPFPQISRPEN